MIIKNNKKVIGVSKGATPITKIYKGNKVVWKKDYIAHIVGSFVESTSKEDRYVYINGEKHYLDTEFDVKIQIDKPWTYGYSDDLSIREIGVSYFGVGLKTITKIKGFKPITLNSFFINQSSLIDISGLVDINTSNCQDLCSCFRFCSSLKDISPIKNWNVEKVINLSSLFEGCSSLSDITEITNNWNPISNTGLNNTFRETNLLELDLHKWNMPLLNRMSAACRACSNLNKVNYSNTINKLVTTVANNFYDAVNLKEVNFDGCNFDGVTNGDNMFKGATSLTTLTGTFYNWKITYSNIQVCPLTVDSCVTLFNALKDNYKATITIKSSSYSQLTSEQLAIATSKGWSVAKE